MLEDVMAGSKYAEVMNDTWGHMAFGAGVYDMTLTLVMGNDGRDMMMVHRDGIPYSPWEYEFAGHMFSMICRNLEGYKSSRIYIKYEDRVEDDGVYQFKGKITASGKCTISKIRGTVKRIFSWNT